MIKNKKIGGLILTRNVGQIIRIGDDIVVIVKEIGVDTVKIGVHLPHNIRVTTKGVSGKYAVVDGKCIKIFKGMGENEKS